MTPIGQQPTPTDSAKEEALRQYLINLQQAKDLLNLWTTHPEEVTVEMLTAAIATLKTLIIDAAAYIKTEDRIKYDQITDLITDNPLQKLNNCETIDAFQNDLNQVLKNAGLYELGKPNHFKDITEDLLTQITKK